MMNQLKFYPFFVLCLILPSTFSVECPLSCQCYQQVGINSIFCLDAALTRIPIFFNFEVKILNFSGNALPNLTDTFENPHYVSLEILDLSRNGIVNVDDRSFRRLKNLLEIDLSSNLLRSVSHETFQNNRFLNTAHFGGNPIEEIEDYAFSPSVYLRRLNFQGCRLKKIRKFAFVNTPMLEYLNLKDNNLKSLSTNVLHFTSQLNELLLDGNPWRCNKKLWMLLKWLKGKNTAKESLLCVYGETENAILWDTMDVDNPTKFRTNDVAKNVKKIRWAKTRKRKRIRRSFELSRGRADGNDGNSKGHRRWEDSLETWDYIGSGNNDYPVDGQWYNVETPEDDEYGKAKHKDQRPTKTHRYEPVQFKGPQNTGNEDALEFYKAKGNAAGSRRRPAFDGSDGHDGRHGDHPSEMRANHRLGHANGENDYSAGAGDDVFPKGEQKPFNTENVKKVGGVPSGDGRSLPKIANPHFQMKISDTLPTIRKPFDNEINNASTLSAEAESNFSELEKDVADDDPDNMNIMLSFIAIELTMLIILLFILYKLWRWNLKGRDSEINTPLNNGNKNVKTYETHSPGYKRYSLSDDDYADARNHQPDEGKYDTESGYLSYHRYNSIEADNNENVTGRRCQRDENDDAASLNENADQNLANGEHRTENDNNVNRRIRRASSVRSAGRRAKLETCRRSISGDIDGEDDSDNK